MLIFFFFKHKTAYEMRISDWSSDVCSSDLPRGVERVIGQHPRTTGAFEGEQRFEHHRIAIGRAGGDGGLDHRVFAGDLIGEYKIGRASCRERECQSV